MIKVPDAVQWYEGMLLEPHHFQHERRTLETKSLYYMSTVQSFYWGVRKVKIDETALVNGILKILALEVIFPDGSCLFVDKLTKNPPQLDLKSVKDTIDNTYTMVHLAIMEYRPDSANIEGDFPRYDSVAVKGCIDENTGDNPIDIPMLSLKLSLLVSNEQVPSRFVSVPLFNVIYKEESYQLGPYISPIVKIDQQTNLYSLIDGVAQSFREKIAFLADKLQSPLSAADSPLIEKYLKYYDVLVSFTPRLEVMLRTQVEHPYSMYKELCSIAGILCQLNPGQIPPTFKAYKHNDIYNNFTDVIHFITQMINLVKNISTAVPFDLNDRLFSLVMQEKWMQSGKIVIGLRHTPSKTEKNMQKWLSGAIISSESVFNAIKDKRVLGAQREVVDQVPELGLVLNKGLLFVEVECEASLIIPGEKLYIINTNDCEDIRPHDIVLFISNIETHNES